jgi:hypothetical protein
VDFDRLLKLSRGVSEPSMEDTVLKGFAQLGYYMDFDELVKQDGAFLDPIPEMQPKCEKTT